MEDSDSDLEESFGGFTVRDVRESIPIAESIALYTSTPKLAKRKQSNLSVDSDIPDAEKEICDSRILTDHSDESDLEGDFSETIYVQTRRRVVEDSESSSDDSVQGDLSISYVANEETNETTMEHSDIDSSVSENNKYKESLPPTQIQESGISSASSKGIYIYI